MAKHIRAAESVEHVADDLEDRLVRLRHDLPSLPLRDKVKRLQEIQHALCTLSVTVVASDGLNPRVAKDRLLGYLQRHVGQIIDGAELDVVSGISDYPRRLRELRVEDGYKIVTGALPDPFSGSTLHPDQYLLSSVEADTSTAERWRVANRIRRSTLSVKDRILEFLKANVGRVVTTEELAYVAKDKREFGRRTRELRTEEGYAIATRMSGRPDLSVSEYMLLSLDRIAEPHDRHISAEVQATVYARDHNTCRNPACRYQYTAGDPRILELHHIVEHVRRGSNTADNLLVLCAVCHDDLHAGRLNILDVMFQGED